MTTLSNVLTNHNAAQTTRIYLCIFILQVVGHLTNRHLAEFLKRCRHSLNENGVLCIKDNVAPLRTFDKEDSSFTR